MSKQKTQYEKWQAGHQKATANIVKYFRKVIKKTLPYHTTEIFVDDLEKICVKVEQLQAELANKDEQKSITEGCVSCAYLGGDCCGTLYWAEDGQILCNECGREFNVSLKGENSDHHKITTYDNKGNII